jgi:hypothetical protein
MDFKDALDTAARSAARMMTTMMVVVTAKPMKATTITGRMKDTLPCVSRLHRRVMAAAAGPTPARQCRDGGLSMDFRYEVNPNRYLY